MPLRENNKIDGATCKKQLVPYCYASPKFLATTWLPEPRPLVLPENTKWGKFIKHAFKSPFREFENRSKNLRQKSFLAVTVKMLCFYNVPAFSYRLGKSK
jgi:hypothetical protein